MSKQSFTAAQREAIWLAHSKKCAYTRELLDISNFHIDHIIPETLNSNPKLRSDTLRKLNLSQDFDLLGWENLLPCRPGANLQKSAEVFEPAHTHFFLGVAASKKTDVVDHLKIIEHRKNRGRALILLQQCLERGELTAVEIAQVLEQYREEPEAIFELLQGMQFTDEDEITVISRADIETLRNRSVRLGENNHINGVTLTNDDDVERFVSTCREYDEALSQGFYAKTTFDMKMASWFEHQCGLLSALEAADSPERSFVANPRVSVIDLSLMPFYLFPNLSDVADSIESNISYQDKVDDGTLTIKRVSQNLLRIESSSMGQQLIEVIRADFNSDGIEDILLFEYCYATEGTLGFGGVKMITRFSSTGMFELISTPTPCDC
ncbi:HNH endonuclease [Yersinia sp. LJYL362]|uniref:HNH endonuclease n=1 Tax=Yersinia sp. LJYL362 TaxID=3402108 RepID=UPI003AB44B16